MGRLSTSDLTWPCWKPGCDWEISVPLGEDEGALASQTDTGEEAQVKHIAGKHPIFYYLGCTNALGRRLLRLRYPAESRYS